MGKITKKEFSQRIQQRFPEEKFKIIEYTSTKKPAKIKCCTCGQVIEITYASNFLAKNKRYGCVNCHGLWREREKRVNAIKQRYEIIQTYVKNTHTYHIVKCKKCGHIRNTSENNLYRNLECGCVTGTFKTRTPEEFINQVNQNTQDTYELVSSYNGQSAKVKLRHKKCGFIRTVWAHDAINGKFLCPHCDKKESRGCRYISNYLKNHNIHFEKETPLRNSQQRFDFYFPAINAALEYDGRQHFEETNFFMPLEQIQALDKKKNQYCKENDITLYRIPYYFTNKEVQQVLDQIINKFNDYPKRSRN